MMAAVLEALARTVIREAGEDVLLEVAGQALKALERFSTGQQSAPETEAELHALRDYETRVAKLADIRAKSVEALAKKP